MAASLSELAVRPSDLSTHTADVFRISEVLQTLVQHCQNNAAAISRLEASVAKLVPLISTVDTHAELLQQQTAALHPESGKVTLQLQRMDNYFASVVEPKLAEVDRLLERAPTLRLLANSAGPSLNASVASQRPPPVQVSSPPMTPRLPGSLGASFTQHEPAAPPSPSAASAAASDGLLQALLQHPDLARMLLAETEPLIVKQVAHILEEHSKELRHRSQQMETNLELSLEDSRRGLAVGMQERFNRFERSFRQTTNEVFEKVSQSQATLDERTQQLASRLTALGAEQQSIRQYLELLVRALNTRNESWKALVREIMVDTRLLYDIFGLNTETARAALGCRGGLEQDESSNEEAHYELMLVKPQSSARELAYSAKWHECTRKASLPQSSSLQKKTSVPNLPSPELSVFMSAPSFIHLLDSVHSAMRDRLSELQQDVNSDLSRQVLELTREMAQRPTGDRVRELIQTRAVEPLGVQIRELKEKLESTDATKANLVYLHDVLRSKADVQLLQDKAERSAVRTALDDLDERIQDLVERVNSNAELHSLSRVVQELRDVKLDKADPTWSSLVHTLHANGFLPQATVSSGNAKCISCARPVGDSREAGRYNMPALPTSRGYVLPSPNSSTGLREPSVASLTELPLSDSQQHESFTSFLQTLHRPSDASIKHAVSTRDARSPRLAYESTQSSNGVSLTADSLEVAVEITSLSPHAVTPNRPKPAANSSMKSPTRPPAASPLVASTSPRAPAATPSPVHSLPQASVTSETGKQRPGSAPVPVTRRPFRNQYPRPPAPPTQAHQPAGGTSALSIELATEQQKAAAANSGALYIRLDGSPADLESAGVLTVSPKTWAQTPPRSGQE
eukprot:TRINITY_DN20282_c0_g1_i1.p1 TRINITY_DN20282_c0_g1~~TRINITY_DN20282_c0_g1_i1.p1  ORF type:complete len:857 (-),score=116.33 TRINITY_DN20282_c0_g1_i1:14-2584(-)